VGRKPNYAFERNARVKAKAEKRQAKLAAKTNRSADATSSEAEPDAATSEPSTQVKAGDC